MTPPPVPSASASPLDELWSGRPRIPRAIAALLAFSELDASLPGLMAAGHAELAVASHADSLAARRAFAAEYGVPAAEAGAVLDGMMRTAIRHTTRVPGESVEALLPARLVRHLGFVDGRAGHSTPPLTAQPGFSAPREVAETVPPEAAGITLRVQEVLGQAYDHGYTDGTAWRVLETRFPDVLRQVAEQVARHFRPRRRPRAGEAAPDPVRPPWSDFLHDLTATTSAPAALTTRVATALARAYRARSARRRVARHLTTAPTPIVGLVDFLSQPSRGARARAARREALLLAAAWGFSPQVVVLATTAGAAAALAELEAMPRQLERARAARDVLRALARPVPEPTLSEPPGTTRSGRPVARVVWPPASGAGIPQRPRLGRRWRPARLERAAGLRHSGPAPRWNQVAVTDPAWLCVAGGSVEGTSATCVDSGMVEADALDLSRYPVEGAEARLLLVQVLRLDAPPLTRDEARAWYLRHRLAVRAAPAVLGQSNPRALDTARAEAAMVVHAQDRDLERLEGSWRQASREVEEGQQAVAPGSPLDDDLVLQYAQTVLLLEALRTRARAEARHLLAKHLGTQGELTPQSVRRAFLRSSSHLDAARHHAPRFADRLAWALRVESLPLAEAAEVASGGEVTS